MGANENKGWWWFINHGGMCDVFCAPSLSEAVETAFAKTGTLHDVQDVKGPFLDQRRATVASKGEAR